jgi:hypothetical protein
LSNQEKINWERYLIYKRKINQMSNFLYNGKIVTVNGKIISNQSSTPTPGGTWEGDVRITVADSNFGSFAPGVHIVTNPTSYIPGYWSYTNSDGTNILSLQLDANHTGYSGSDWIWMGSSYGGTWSSKTTGVVKSSQGATNKLSVTSFKQYTTGLGSSITLEQILV